MQCIPITEVKELPDKVKEDFIWGFGTTAGQAYKDLLGALKRTGQGIIYFLITCWTWVIPWLIIILIGRWAYKKWAGPWIKSQQKKAQAITAPKD